MNDFLQLENKHVLVTGATSGIGRQTAILISEFGARVTIVGRREDELLETISMMHGKGHHFVPFDLSRIDEIEEMVKHAVENGGPTDGFVQCAGVNKDLPINSVKYGKIHDIMLTNFYSFYELTRAICRKGKYNPGLSIVGTSSTASKCGVASQTAYSASKAAMNGTMRAMAKELAPKGIRVNTVLPGPTNTEMYKDYLSLRAGLKQDNNMESIAMRNYLGMNEPSDVANAIAFLLSPASRMITGIELPVDAGYSSC